MPTFRSGTAVVLGVAMLAGCIVPVPKGHNPMAMRLMTRDGLEDYSEEVFRHQNRVMTRLMMASPENNESLSPSDRSRLERAEQRVNDACAPVNQIASARSRGQDTGFEMENDVRQTIRVCQAETRRLEKLLDDLQIPG